MSRSDLPEIIAAFIIGVALIILGLIASLALHIYPHVYVSGCQDVYCAIERGEDGIGDNLARGVGIFGLFLAGVGALGVAAGAGYLAFISWTGARR